MESLRFADHNEYSQKDVMRIREKFDKFAAGSKIVLTTEKDYQRLRSSIFIKELQELPCYYIPVKIKIDRQDEFNQMIKNYVEGNKGNS